MSTNFRDTRRTFRGAKVASLPTVSSIATTLHPQVEHYSAIGYDLAMTNRKKSWARRWLRMYRMGTFW
jgi:hypothetical protein